MSLLSSESSDGLIRAAAFDHVRNLSRIRDHLTTEDLNAGFTFNGERIPLTNPQRGIFKPQQMRYLLSIKTVFPRAGARVWYDDQRTVHRQIYESSEVVDYAFMGTNPDAADNRWLREACSNRIPIRAIEIEQRGLTLAKERDDARFMEHANNAIRDYQSHKRQIQ